jgi:hypothetical protein
MSGTSSRTANVTWNTKTQAARRASSSFHAKRDSSAVADGSTSVAVLSEPAVGVPAGAGAVAGCPVVRRARIRSMRNMRSM